VDKLTSLFGSLFLMAVIDPHPDTRRDLAIGACMGAFAASCSIVISIGAGVAVWVMYPLL
jgi:hypothetical protein